MWQNLWTRKLKWRRFWRASGKVVGFRWQVLEVLASEWKSGRFLVGGFGGFGERGEKWAVSGVRFWRFGRASGKVVGFWVAGLEVLEVPGANLESRKVQKNTGLEVLRPVG